MHVSRLIEPQVSFHHARLKVEWAKHHIQQLDLLCKAFIKSHPYNLTSERDVVSGEFRFHAGMNVPMDCRIGLLAGDICGNLRASLDYAWMGLVRAHNPDQAAKRTMPIGTNQRDLLATIEKAPIGTAAELAKNLLCDQIKPHRDFSGGGNQAICILNDLSNWNKHNMLAISTGRLHVPTMTDGFGNVFVGATAKGYVGPNVSMIRSPSEFKYEGEPSFEVVFAEHEGVDNAPVVPTLLHLSEETSRAIEAFCHTFGMPELES